MKIAIGSDHHGFVQKEFLLEQHTIGNVHITWHDVGCKSPQDSDYPEYAQYVAHEILSGQADLGVLLCGTGSGMAIAANRLSHIYATVAWNEEIARLAREHDNANILVIPADYVTSEEAKNLVAAWLGARFAGGRHGHRLALIDVLSLPEEDDGGGRCCS